MPAILCYLMAGLFGCDPVHRPRDLPSWLTKSIPDDMLDGMRVRESVIKGAGGPLRRFALKRLLTVPPTTPAVDAAARNGFTLEAGKALETVWVKLDRIAEPYRQGNIEQSILEGKTSKTTLDSLDGIRWLRRLA